IAEIEADPATIGAAVLSHFVPDDIAFVLEPPSIHDLQSPGKKRVWHPEIEMSGLIAMARNRHRTDFFDTHRFITAQPYMFGSNFAGAILEAPRRISQNGRKPST